jgi:hypothetical protein
MAALEKNAAKLVLRLVQVPDQTICSEPQTLIASTFEQLPSKEKV